MRNLGSRIKSKSLSSPESQIRRRELRKIFDGGPGLFAYYRDYYEDEFLMSQIIGILKDNAADVFDYVWKKDGGTRDLGVIMQRMRKHYCNNSHL